MRTNPKINVKYPLSYHPDRSEGSENLHFGHTNPKYLYLCSAHLQLEGVSGLGLS